MRSCLHVVLPRTTYRTTYRIHNLSIYISSGGSPNRVHVAIHLIPVKYQSTTTDTVGHEFHWSGVLRCLAAPSLYVTTDWDVIE